jgi:hypothetical protein
MGQKHVTDLFHQRRFRTRWTMIRIKYDELHAVRQRTSATGPRLRRWSKQVFARALAKSPELLELDDHQIRKLRQLEGIERCVWSNTSEVAQSYRFQFEVAPLLARR